MAERPEPQTNPTRKKSKTVEAELQELRTGSLIHLALHDVIKSISEIQAATRETSLKLDAIKPQVENIVAQTTKTNGRVTSLEIWQAKSTGVMAAIAAMGGFVGWLVAQVIAFIKH